MSGTGYLVSSPGTSDYKDLSEIFQQGSTVNKTGFTIPSGQDLSDIFAPLGNATPLMYNTNMISLNGQDLSQIFLPIPSVSITAPADKYYSYTTTDGYTVVIFADYTSQTTTPPASPTTNIGNNSVTGITVQFKNFNLNPVYVTVVGGGGGGGAGATSSVATFNIFVGGGGGGGGGVYTTTLFPTNQDYNIQVGGGGAVKTAGVQSFLKAIDSSVVAVGGGGNRGGNATATSKESSPGGGGSGGIGGTPTTVTTGCSGGKGGSYFAGNGQTVQGAAGVSSSDFSIYPSISYKFGGGGGGGYAQYASTSPPAPAPAAQYVPAGGLGGGGSSNAGAQGNGGVIYTGPSSIYYNVGDILKNGYPGVGGGGSGGNANGTGLAGGVGGSGVVILCYKTVNPQ